MSTQISGFISNLKSYGLARTNRFRATFNLPSSLSVSTSSSITSSSTQTSSGGDSTENTKRLSYMCQSASIPGYTLGAQESTMTGLGRKMPMDRSTGDLEVRFLCGGDMQEKKVFDAWYHAIFDTNLKLSYYDDYVTDITIEHLDVSEETIYSALITECYPSIIGPIVFENGDLNSLMSFSVVFNYHRIQENDGSVSVGNTVTTSNLSFGNNPATQEVSTNNTLQLPDAPATSPNYSLYVIDVMKNIDRVKAEIANGLDAQAASRIIRNLQRDLAAATGVGEDITPALTYLNNILGTVTRGSAIGTAQAILG